MLRPEASAPCDDDDLHSLRLAGVMSALDMVLDPELDEPVTSMGFIQDVALNGRMAEIAFRLPTFWCSANFAFLMASDMREAVERLEFIDEARVRLVDHFAAGKINRGVAERVGFGAVFAGEARGDLDDIRRAFRERAFLGRQDRLLELLIERCGVETALAGTMTDLERLAGHDAPEIRGAAMRYLAMRRHEGGSTAASDPAFIALTGEPIRPDTYAMHRRASRGVRSAAEANAAMCRIYLEARISHPAPGCEPSRLRDDVDD
jgi:metal-sulfur cluster biosynthetic enzyme